MCFTLPTHHFLSLLRTIPSEAVMATPPPADPAPPGVTIVIEESQPLVLDPEAVQNLIGRLSLLSPFSAISLSRAL